jgi:hypothetical protein
MLTIFDSRGNSCPHDGHVTIPQPLDIGQPREHASPSWRVNAWPHIPQSIIVSLRTP